MEVIARKKLRITGKGDKTMTDKEIGNFIMYYKRLTKHMLKTLTEQLTPSSILIKNTDLNQLNLIK